MEVPLAGLEMLRNRRTVRRFRPDAVPAAALAMLVQAGAWAPSPHHTRPWRFAVVERGSRREQLARAMGERWRADLQRDDETGAAIAGKLERSFAKISQAPALIVACALPGVLDSYPDAERQRAELTMGAHSLGAAIENILLAALAHGLGGYWMCAPLFCPQTVADELDLPAGWVPQAFVLVGYPHDSLPPHIDDALTPLVVWR